ncbi:MAG: phosphoheptose isomerase [Planctomycetota bacterium]|nr:MAG: phosphoheptose isomerase [Planctomycetota bacterium]RKY14176.1 MAG: phosphoheptose isomerase [Planctomycetota bacterium]
MESKKQRILDTIKLHKKLLSDLEANRTEAIERAAKLLIDCIAVGGCVYICGNGGSAADAQHIAAELVGRFIRERKGLPAVALTTDTSILTSIGNDYGFEQIFSRQVEALLKEDDVLWAFSTSGTSKNVLAAAKLTKDKGGSILAFTGRKDSPLEDMSDVCICIEGPTATVQEIHQVAYHIICDLVEEAIA